MMLTIPVLFVLVLLSGATVNSISGLREYCNSETFSAACADDEVIVIRSALYGRMRTGRCLSHDSGVNPCWQNVIRQADRLCSGRRTCDVRVPEPMFDATQPCPRNMRVYLEIIYECVQVVTVPHPECESKKYAVVQQPFGYLSSRVTDERGYGTMACPYRIELPRGQRINLTLIDFTTPTGPLVDPPSHGLGGPTSGGGLYGSPVGGAVYDPVYVQQSARTCYQYAMITEKSSTTRNVRICGGERRERNIYTSRSNAIEIRITTRTTEHSIADYHFLFQFGAIGCSDPDPPRYGWLIRDNDGVTMGCNYSDHEWRMTCDGFKWVGAIENCSSGKPQRIFFNIGGLTIPYTAISIGIIVGLAAIFVILLLLITMICIEWAKSRRRQRKRRRRSLSRSTEPTPIATALPADAVVPDSIPRPAVRAEANHYRRDPSVKPLQSTSDQHQHSPSAINATSTLSKLSNSSTQHHHQQQQPTAPPPQRSQQRNTVHFNTQVTVVQPEAVPLTPPPTSAGDLCLPPPPPPPPTHQPLNDHCGGSRPSMASVGSVTISSVPLQEPSASHEDIYVARCSSRDMWPAAPPPLSSAGASVILMPTSHGTGSVFVPPPPEFDSNGMPTSIVSSVTSTAGNSPSTTFNSSLDGYGTPPGLSTSSGGGTTLPRRNSMLAAMTTDLIDDVSMGTGGGPLNQPDDFTHIYETPKYLRREKAATLRHTGSSNTRSRSQYGTMVAQPCGDGRQQHQQVHTWNRQQLMQQQQQQQQRADNHGGGPTYISRTMPRRDGGMNGGNIGRPS